MTRGRFDAAHLLMHIDPLVSIPPREDIGVVGAGVIGQQFPGRSVQRHFLANSAFGLSDSMKPRSTALLLPPGCFLSSGALAGNLVPADYGGPGRGHITD